MRTISSYLVVHGDVTSGTFERLVQAKLDQQFQPYGTPFFTRNERGLVVGHQAVVLNAYDEASSEPLPDATRPAGTPPSGGRGSTRS